MKKETTLLQRIPTLISEEVTSGSFSIAANNVKEDSIDVAKTGYTPIGIEGFYFGGSGVSFLAPYRIRLVGSLAYYGIRNHNSSQATGITVTVRVLYIKLGG
ncbi:MAG: hypothetical protein K6B42_07575 [Clostridia bacterium]|nr:hypothetical protein [Clostridia bacterium]